MFYYFIHSGCGTTVSDACVLKAAKVSEESLQVAGFHFWLPLTYLDGRPLRSFAVANVSLTAVWRTGFDATLSQRKSS